LSSKDDINSSYKPRSKSKPRLDMSFNNLATNRSQKSPEPSKPKLHADIPPKNKKSMHDAQCSPILFNKELSQEVSDDESYKKKTKRYQETLQEKYGKEVKTGDWKDSGLYKYVED
jgi:hypothetical protein